MIGVDYEHISAERHVILDPASQRPRMPVGPGGVGVLDTVDLDRVVAGDALARAHSPHPGPETRPDPVEVALRMALIGRQAPPASSTLTLAVPLPW